MRPTAAQRRARALQANRVYKRKRLAAVLAAVFVVVVAALVLWSIYLLIHVAASSHAASSIEQLQGESSGVQSSAGLQRLRANGQESLENELANWLDSDLHRCEYVQDLLDNGKSIGPPLPESGKQRPGGPFYLKQPLLHTVDPASGEEVVVLRYNIYNKSPSWTQHTDKFRNTIKVLLWNRRIQSSIFPKLYGFCNSINGFHHIVVEFIRDDVYALPPPLGLDDCFQRADKINSLFASLDEDFHLTFADIKPGQWMFRADGTAVLQDVDDMVVPGAKMVYDDLEKWHMNRIASEARLSWQEMDRIWRLSVMPRNEVSVRFVSMNLPFIMDNLGFKWSKCGMTTEFAGCLRRWRAWAVELDDAAWPSPLQLRDALRDCYSTGDFTRTLRPAAPWRDLEPMDPSKYKLPTACKREYDKPDGSQTFTRCGHSCCRSKGSDKCYYAAADQMCT
ncbi:Hypothetical Protein FCC1311_040312 [Hondaea fermentalgiana]|uniref:Uncharacterized protein n=1 Tax=Hondaea fermentalgiana TaxID=2315210 RepID=A0A2R5GDL0_9STRA|nr:Hypothetical Protein FCC1311_040312 [Hondaea fermentalgiana]|eukprot:GBG27808.1 Hypothetical Protein FCC1311_040312 [Hondaea fermentalgiana]